MQTIDGQPFDPDVAATLLLLLDEAWIRNEAYQEQARLAAGPASATPSERSPYATVGFAGLEVLAKIAGYPDLSSACDRLVSLDGLPEASS